MQLDFLRQSIPTKQPAAKIARKFRWPRFFAPKTAALPAKQQFDISAQNAVFYAQSEAKRRGAAHVDTEHLLMGILREKDHRAARVFGSLNLDRIAVYAKIDGICIPGTQRMAWSHDLGPRAKRALAYAFAEARTLNDKHLGAEHLLLGLVREGEGKAACVLDEMGVTLERTRHVVLETASQGIWRGFRRWWSRLIPKKAGDSGAGHSSVA